MSNVENYNLTKVRAGVTMTQMLVEVYLAVACRQAPNEKGFGFKPARK